MLSVVIVNYRTPEDLVALLDSLRANPPAAVPMEVIVVDNASGDDSPGRVRTGYPEVRLIVSPTNGGFAAGVNQGLAAATGDFLLVLNPDITLHSDSLDRLLDFMKANPRAGLAASRLNSPDGSLQYTCRTYYTFWTILLRRTFLGRLLPDSRALRDHMMLDYDHRAAREVDWVAGACMMVRRAALEEVGPMDERYFMYFEDVDWCTRMHRRGWGVWYVPESVMTHGWRRASAGGLTRAARVHAGSFFRFWEKWSAGLYLFRRYRGPLRSAIFLLVDILMLNVAFLLAYLFREGMAPLLAKPNFPLTHYWSFIVTTNLAALISFSLGGLYRDVDRGDWIDTLFSTGRALLGACFFLFVATFVLYADSRAYSRLIILSFWPLAAMLVTLERRWLYGLLERARERRINVRRVGLIGSDAWIDDMARALRQDPRHGCEPIRLALPPADRPEALRASLEDERASDLVISTSALPDRPGAAAAWLEPVRQAGIRVHLSGPISDLLTRDARVAPLGGQSLLQLNRSSGWGATPVARRIFEITVALLFLIFQLPGAVMIGFAGLLTGRRMHRSESGAWSGPGWAGGLLRRLSIDRYPGWFGVIGGRLRLVAGSDPGPALFDAGDVAIRAGSGYSLSWSPERDLKTIVRDILARLRGGGTPGNGSTPLLERSHRSALR